MKQLEEKNLERYKVVKKIVEGKLKLQPLNVRTLERVSWYEIRQRVERTDVGTEGYVLADIEESESELSDPEDSGEEEFDDGESKEESTKKRKETKATESESSEIAKWGNLKFDDDESEEEPAKKRNKTKATGR
ncbi:hypothetical protein N0V85_006164 [Neurospora sp. IMI 360204]|nr:hypothetical protein N0V85_006164 [Neurospora sp. IMI 360204]